MSKFPGSRKCDGANFGFQTELPTLSNPWIVNFKNCHLSDHHLLRLNALQYLNICKTGENLKPKKNSSKCRPRLEKLTLCTGSMRNHCRRSSFAMLIPLCSAFVCQIDHQLCTFVYIPGPQVETMFRDASYKNVTCKITCPLSRFGIFWLEKFDARSWTISWQSN